MNATVRVALAVLSSIVCVGLVVGSCAQWKPDECASGRECPPGTRCAAAQDICIATACGDGVIEMTERCDDGNIIEGDGCSPTCHSTEVCGNGIVDVFASEAFVDEACDDIGESATCNWDCTVARCGDGILNTTAGEQCDDGQDSSLCDGDCTFPMCGDGYVNKIVGEVCDDAGDSADCDADCTIPACGDGHENLLAEECDDGGDSSTCDADCTSSMCADGYLNLVAGEQCDTGGDSLECDADCTFASCGDGYMNIEANETCDDGNGNNRDACIIESLALEAPIRCQDAVCGDGHTWTGQETCDDGDTIEGGNGCTDTCDATQGLICGADADMERIGRPGRGTGLKVAFDSFTIIGNQVKVRYVPKPSMPGGGRFMALPLVYTYNPAGDDQNEWYVDTFEDTNGFWFTITVNGMSGDSYVSGILYVLGFDGVNSDFHCSPTLVAGDSHLISPQEQSARTKVVRLDHVHAYRSLDDNDLGYRLSRSLLPDCTSQSQLNLLYNTPHGQADWRACSLFLAEEIRIIEQEFIVSASTTEDIDIPLETNAEQIWFPVITTYDSNADDDLGYGVNCLLNNTQLSCTAHAVDAGDGSISGRIVLLEAESGF